MPIPARLLVAALALTCGVTTTEARTRRAPKSLQDFTALVVKVKDGDSLEVKKGEDIHEVRLARLDAPELHQERGEQAKQFTEAKALGATVHITAKSLDSYGRIVGDVKYRGGRSLNEDLVAAGWAWWYKRLYPKDGTMESLERRARAQKLGLWQDQAPLPPWQWREKSRK